MISPDHVMTPAVLVDYVVTTSLTMDAQTVIADASRTSSPTACW